MINQITRRRFTCAYAAVAVVVTVWIDVLLDSRSMCPTSMHGCPHVGDSGVASVIGLRVKPSGCANIFVNEAKSEQNATD